MNDPAKPLTKLKEEMMRTLTFFYGHDEKVPEVKGFLGTAKIWFLCEKPSTGFPIDFPNRLTRMFYELLRDHGFAEAHITDIVKTRGSRGPLRNDDIRLNLPLLTKEVELLNPRYVVAVGTEVSDFLKNHKRIFPGAELHPTSITHYAQANYQSFSKIRSKLDADLRQVAVICKKKGLI